MARGVYELYAIRYATNPRRRRHENFIHGVPDDPHDRPMPMDFYVWAAVGEGRTFLIDSGSDAATCAARGHDFLCCPAAALKRLGIDPAGVNDVVTTHLHWDHSGNFEKFPNARFHVQRREVAHATGPAMCSPYLRRPYDIEHMCGFLRSLYGGRVAFHEGEEELAPGLTIRHVGGHTPGLQIVRVMTRRGWVVVASDALHFYANRATLNPFPVVVDLADYVAAWNALRPLAESEDHIIPGHDPAVFRQYAAVSPEHAGLAVRLDVDPAPVPS